MRARPRGGRVPVIAALVLLHGGTYFVVTRATLLRPAGALRDFTTPLDALIPHLPWTWPLYWIAYPFVILGGGATLLRLPDPSFRRAVGALVAMILVGAIVQIAFPARAPWPASPAAAQRRFHESPLVLPYATLPSMHVAFTLFAAGVRALTMATRASYLAGAVVVLLVTVGTLTLKEHVALDALTGLALAAATLAWWRRPAR
ncbi:MAG TPA: phosphatase PAP2 family protein [Gemmatimonadales bacterium]|nr:phosphatase PAP2 family protein [Gemmatimonadales bacterium]